MRTVILAIVAAGLFVTARRAEAYPQYQLSRDQTCSACHLSPAGEYLIFDRRAHAVYTYSKTAAAPKRSTRPCPREIPTTWSAWLDVMRC